MALGLKDLAFLERIVQKMASHIQSCSSFKGVVKADCISRTGDIMLDLEHGLRWPFEAGFGPDSQRAKWGFLFNTAAYLSAHVSIMAIDSMAEGYKNKYLMKPKVMPFNDVLHKHAMFAISDMGEWSNTIVEWRREQIGPASLCDMKEYLWQSFQQVCETRWHSSEWVLTGPNNEFTGVKRSNPMNTTTGSSTATEQSPASKRSGTVNGVEDIGDFEDLTWTEPDPLEQLSKFGGVDNYKRMLYRVQVYDNVERKVIYEAFKDADPSSRGITLDKLAIEALEFREKAVDERISNIKDLAVAFDARKSVVKASNFITQKLEKM